MTRERTAFSFTQDNCAATFTMQDGRRFDLCDTFNVRVIICQELYYDELWYEPQWQWNRLEIRASCKRQASLPVFEPGIVRFQPNSNETVTTGQMVNIATHWQHPRESKQDLFFTSDFNAIVHAMAESGCMQFEKVTVGELGCIQLPEWLKAWQDTSWSQMSLFTVDRTDTTEADEPIILASA